MRNTFFTLLTFAVLLSSCKKENTVWETDWSAPIINDTLSLKNWVNDSTLASSGGYYVVDFNRTLLNAGVNDFFTIPDTIIKKNYGIAFAFINVPPNYTFFNEQSENDLALKGVELKQIIAKQGFLDITVKNPVSTKAFFNVKLIGATKNGVPFSQDIVADAGTIANPGVANVTLDLSGYSINLTGINGDKRNRLTSKVTVTSDPNGPTITLTNSHFIKVDVGIRGIELDYARGYFGNQIVSDTTDFMLDLMNLVQSGTVDFPASSIKFVIENGMKVGGRGLLSLFKSENAWANVVALTHPQIGTPFMLNPATGGWDGINPGMKELVFDGTNSNMEAVLENLGKKYTAGYTVELNPWGNISAGSDEIYPSSRFKVKVVATMPLKAGLDQLTIQDTFPVDLAQTSSNVRVTKGELFLKASNAFPISANVKLMLLDANKNVLYSINSSDIIQSAEYGAIDAVSGLKVNSSDVKWVLGTTVLADLAAIKFIIVQSKFNTPNPSTGVNEQYQIPAGAFLSVKLKTRFTTENQF